MSRPTAELVAAVHDGKFVYAAARLPDGTEYDLPATSIRLEANASAIAELKITSLRFDVVATGVPN